MSEQNRTERDLVTGRISRATFLRVAAAGAAATTLSPLTTTAVADTAKPEATDPGSGSVPPGPSTHGFLAKDILDWSPESDEHARHFRCLIPRAERIAPFRPTQAHPSLDPGTQLLTISGDYRGDVYDVRAQPIGDQSQVYTQRFWPYIDIYASWHGQVVPSEKHPDPDDDDLDYGVIDIPNPGWTEAAHKNGARTIGCWFWPRDDNFDTWVQKDSKGGFPVGKKLVEIKQYFGFDGYFINQEKTVTKEQITALFDMIRYMKSLDHDLYIQYYDADLPKSGKLDYQNQINEKNVGSLGTPDDPIADSIFMNYDWPKADPDLTGSRSTVRRHGFDPKKSAFGSTECQQGGFNPLENFSDYASPTKKAPVSWALFVENEIWNTAAEKGKTDTVKGRIKYRDYERKFWSGPEGDPSKSGKLKRREPPYRTNLLDYKVWDGVCHSIAEKSAFSSLPLLTNFNIGTGSHFFLHGRRVAGSWNNAGIADPSPTWQYWTHHEGEAQSAVSLDETMAWEGGHSLKISGTAPHRDAVTLHLFKTAIRLPHRPQMAVKVAGTCGGVDLGLVFRDRPSHTEWLPMHGSWPEHGWHTLSTTLGHHSGRTIVKISLRVRGSRTGDIDLNLGQFKAATGRRRPGRVTDFSIDKVEQHNGHVSAYLSWKLARHAVAYDLFTAGDNSWIGRVHRDVFYAHDIAAGKRQLSIDIVPIASDGTRGPRTTATHQITQ